MVLYSNEVKNFLDKLYFYEITHRNDLQTPLYNYYEGKLHDVDKLNRHILSSTFPMSRDGLFGLIIGRLEFGYSFDGTNACVEYYVNKKPQNDWFDWLIKEARNSLNKDRLNEIINETVLRVLRKHISRVV